MSTLKVAERFWEKIIRPRICVFHMHLIDLHKDVGWRARRRARHGHGSCQYKDMLTCWLAGAPAGAPAARPPARYASTYYI